MAGWLHDLLQWFVHPGGGRRGGQDPRQGRLADRGGRVRQAAGGARRVGHDSADSAREGEDLRDRDAQRLGQPVRDPLARERFGPRQRNQVRESAYMPVDTSIMLVGTKEAGMIMWIVICPDPEG